MRTGEKVPPIETQIIDFLRKETGSEPEPQKTLLELCRGNKTKVRILILQLEIGMKDRLCDEQLIPDIQNRSIEFIVWALGRSFQQPTEEFSS